MTYQRNATLNHRAQNSPQKTIAPAEPLRNPEEKKEEGVKINGFGQVLEMLKVADPEFRISLLKRMYQADPRTARLLHKELVNQGILRE
jgi:hypothetical protein